MQGKSAYQSAYLSWPQETGFLLFGSARPGFLGGMRNIALAVEASAWGESASYSVYRQDSLSIDKDRYVTYGTANPDGWVPVRHQKNDMEHHLSVLPPRLNGMSGIKD